MEPKKLDIIASRYNAKAAIPQGASYDDFLSFVDVVAAERANNLRRGVTDEDYEFALASGCVPIPNWPKKPPEGFQDKLKGLIRGASVDERTREAIRFRLKKNLLKLSREEFRRRRLSVTSVWT